MPDGEDPSFRLFSMYFAAADGISAQLNRTTSQERQDDVTEQTAGDTGPGIWSDVLLCVALFCPERRKEVRVKQTVYPRAMDTQTVDLQSVGQPGRYCDRKRRVDWLRGGDSVRRAIPAIQAGDLAALEALAQEQQQSQKIKK